MLLSKLPSITRFSSQPFTSHWCTEKITFLYFWQCFHNKWLISQHDSSLLLTVWHTLAKAMYLRVHFRMKALWYKEHTSHLQSHPDDNNFSHFCQIVFLIRRELPNLFISTYIPGTHVHFSIHIPRWRINTLQCIGLSSLIPLTSASSWTKGA